MLQTVTILLTDDQLSYFARQGLEPRAYILKLINEDMGRSSSVTHVVEMIAGEEQVIALPPIPSGGTVNYQIVLTERKH